VGLSIFAVEGVSELSSTIIGAVASLKVSDICY